MSKGAKGFVFGVAVGIAVHYAWMSAQTRKPTMGG